MPQRRRLTWRLQRAKAGALPLWALVIAVPRGIGAADLIRQTRKQCTDLATDPRLHSPPPPENITCTHRNNPSCLPASGPATHFLAIVIATSLATAHSGLDQNTFPFVAPSRYSACMWGARNVEPATRQNSTPVPYDISTRNRANMCFPTFSGSVASPASHIYPSHTPTTVDI